MLVRLTGMHGKACYLESTKVETVDSATDENERLLTVIHLDNGRAIVTEPLEEVVQAINAANGHNLN
jgi:uncharacterized protein YlzI (FlbEa/FlbD family)